MQVSIHIKSKKKLRNDDIYVQKARHFAKIKTICVTFLFTKSQTLYIKQFFMMFLKLAFLYRKKSQHFALRDVLIYQKQTLCKKKDVLNIRNPDTLRYAIFHGVFEIVGGGGGEVFMSKTQCTLR